MHASLPAGRRGRALALAFACIVVALLWLAVFAPLAGWYEQRDEALQARRVLAAHEAALVGTLAQLQAAAGDAAHRPMQLATLNGATDAYASATLQGLLQAMAGKAGTTLTSIDTLPGAPVGAYQRIGLRVAMTATWPVFIGFLQSVETATPQMLVDDLSLHSSALTLAGSHDLPIQAGFTVFAFRSRTASR